MSKKISNIEKLYLLKQERMALVLLLAALLEVKRAVHCEITEGLFRKIAGKSFSVRVSSHVLVAKNQRSLAINFAEKSLLLREVYYAIFSKQVIGAEYRPILVSLLAKLREGKSPLASHS